MPETLTAGLDPTIALGLICLSFLASFVTIALGIGGGVLLLATMASLVPASALIPVHGLIQLGSNGFRALLMAKKTSWPPVAAFAVGALIGAIIGGMIVVDLPAGYVTIGVGLFVIFSVFFRPPAWLGRNGGLTGAFSSFLTMFFGATGPFVATYVKSLELGREAHVGTHATLMTVQHTLKVIAFGMLGFAFGPWIGFIAAMIAAGFLGTLAGRFVLVKISDIAFKRVLDVLLVLLSLRLIWVGFADLKG